jgi:hypothetical protein
MKTTNVHSTTRLPDGARSNSTLRTGAEVLPDPPARFSSAIGDTERRLRWTLVLAILGVVVPLDLSFINWFVGGTIHRILDTLITDYLLNLSFGLAVLTVPLSVIVILMSVRRRTIARTDWGIVAQG